MKIRFVYPVIMLFPFFFLSCSSYSKQYPISEYTPIAQKPCNELDSSLYLFFEGEKLDFNYTKIGYVEVVGSKYDTDFELLNHLKYKAFSNCANGLINIETGYKQREERLTDDNNNKVFYDAKYYKALAVRINTNSTFLSQHHSESIATSRLENTDQKLVEEKINDNKKSYQYLLLSILGIGALLAIGGTM